MNLFFSSFLKRSLFLCFALLLFVPLLGCPHSVPTSLPENVQAKPAFFREVSQSSGLNYKWTIPGSRPLHILQTIGNGCAFLDYDRDGNLDILLVGQKTALYKGDGKGHFTDVSEAMGLSKLSGHFLGCAIGDVDNDGFDDIYLSGYRTGLLLKNKEGKRFDDITAASGLKPQPWGTSCAFLETTPGSRRLDLIVLNYCNFDPKVNQLLCDEHGVKTSCGPRHYIPIKAVFYQNLGGGRFKDISKQAGMTGVNGRGLGVAVIDENGKGQLSIAIANDETPGDLLRQIGKANSPQFRNDGAASGTATDRDGNMHGGMGMDWGDYDNDGKFDLFVATYYGEFKSLYQSEGGGSYHDFALPAGIGDTAKNYVTFGSKWLDYDNDGKLDLALANGHVEDNIAEVSPGQMYREKSLLFHNKGGLPVTFEEVSEKAGADFSRPIVGRGLAVGDYDNDGRLDLLVVDSEGAPLLLHNEVTDSGHWIGFRLEGGQGNRNGYGATITAETESGKQIRLCGTDGSYLSASDARVHFGLGKNTKVTRLTIQWLGGKTQTVENLEGDRYYTIQEGQAPR